MQDAEREFDKLELLQSGGPVVFEIDGNEFKLRQPTPLEQDRMAFARTSTTDWAIVQYRNLGMDKEPISEASRETQRIYLEMLETDYNNANEAGDGERVREVAQMIDNVRGNWPTTLAEERARDMGTVAVRRFVLDRLFTGDRTAFERLTAPDPLRHNAVSEAVDRLLAIVNHDPNSNGRNPAN